MRERLERAIRQIVRSCLWLLTLLSSILQSCAHVKYHISMQFVILQGEKIPQQHITVSYFCFMKNSLAPVALYKYHLGSAGLAGCAISDTPLYVSLNWQYNPALSPEKALFFLRRQERSEVATGSVQACRLAGFQLVAAYLTMCKLIHHPTAPF